ncbi:MAG: DUF4956 domain-containing protein [Ardenticatenaceae bacterium]|nr:DUF4956 domain-containing protein [Ardenticatenaceae bacterium]
MLTSINLLTGFVANLAIALLIVRFIYYPVRQNKNYVFTFLAFNTIIFFVMSLLTTIDLSVGAGFGLFAIFSVLRYRTSPMPARDMTYLFVLIGLPVINSGLVANSAWSSLLIVNVAIVAVLYVLEQGWGFHYEQSQRITYERIDLIRPENHNLLLDDLRERTGLPVKRFEIGNINFLKDVADIKIYFDDPRQRGWTNDDVLFLGHVEETAVSPER